VSLRGALVRGRWHEVSAVRLPEEEEGVGGALRVRREERVQEVEHVARNRGLVVVHVGLHARAEESPCSGAQVTRVFISKSLLLFFEGLLVAPPAGVA
jgi:hypothetical protein